eukprot:g16010.t1
MPPELRGQEQPPSSTAAAASRLVLAQPGMFFSWRASAAIATEITPPPQTPPIGIAKQPPHRRRSEQQEHAENRGRMMVASLDAADAGAPSESEVVRDSGGGEAGGNATDRAGAADGWAGFVVKDAPAGQGETEIFGGDLLLAVDGIPLSSASLKEWVETTTASVSNTAPSASPSTPTVGRLAAVFPLVDIDWDPYLGTFRDTRHGPTSGATQPATPNTPPPAPSVGSLDDHRCSAGSPDPACAELAGAGAGSSAGAASAPPSAGFPLKGFLRVELVGLEEAEVTFRPMGARRAALIAERENAAAAEEEERQRAIAEAKASLEAAKRDQEEENRKAEEAARARDAERAREQAEADRKAEEKKQEEARIRREEEAARKSAEKSKKNVAKMRKEGKEFTFTAEYKEVAPMGLTFDLANPLAVVSEVVAGGTSQAAGVNVGDHLVRVNDKDTSKMKPTAALKLLQRAVWPRLLTFTAPENLVAEGEDQPLFLYLVVTEPEIVRGEYLMQAPKDWGGLRTTSTNETDGGGGVVPRLWSCEPRPMALVDPPPACQRNLRMLGGGTGEIGKEGRAVIALVKRGACTFVEKAKNVQLAVLNNNAPPENPAAASPPPPTPPRPTITSSGDGGITITTTAAAAATAAAATAATNGSHVGDAGDAWATAELVVGGGMVLLNGEDSLTDMPAGNLLTDDVSIPVAMISRGNGSSIEALLSWGVDVRAAMSPLGACPPPPPMAPANPASTKPRKADDDGGRFVVLSKTEGAADFDYRLARYGPGIEAAGGAGAHAVAVAEPFDGCDDKAYTASEEAVRAAGMFVAVERGGCSFSMKTLAAQRAGAVGVIIVNTAEATLRVMADAGDGEKALIPTVMVSAAAGRFLSAAATGSSRSSILARFIREEFDAGRG